MLQQDAHKIEYNLYRIIKGYYFITVNNNIYKVVYPTIDIKYKAQQIYIDILENNKYEIFWYSDIQLKMLLDRQDIWNNQKESILKQQEKLLDSEKIALYHNYMNQDKKKYHKKSIKYISSNIASMLTEKTSLDYLTLKFFAETVKNEFIIMNCIYNEKENIKIFNSSSLNSSDYRLIQNISKEILQKQLTATQLREIAKSDLWQSYYNGDHTFASNSIDQNDDQRHLIKLTKMYDSVRQHPECPSDDIIKDDDALDGWFLSQKEKSEKEKNKQQVLDKVSGSNKLSNSGELFVLTNDIQEARTIYNLNDEKTKQEIAKTKQTASKKGQIKWTDLDHVIQNKLVEDGKAGYDKVKGEIK